MLSPAAARVVRADYSLDAAYRPFLRIDGADVRNDAAAGFQPSARAKLQLRALLIHTKLDDERQRPHRKPVSGYFENRFPEHASRPASVVVFDLHPE